MDEHGRGVGESRERHGLFGDYTEHRDESGAKIGESRLREGFFGPYVEHTGVPWYMRVRPRSNDGDILATLIQWGILAAAVIFVLALVLVTWKLWLGMVALSAALSAVLAFSAARGGWAVTLNDRLGGYAGFLGPVLAVSLGLVFVYVLGSSNPLWGKLLLTVIVAAAGIACFHVSGWVFSLSARWTEHEA